MNKTLGLLFKVYEENNEKFNNPSMRMAITALLISSKDYYDIYCAGMCDATTILLATRSKQMEPSIN